MSRTSYTLLSAMPSEVTVTGEKVPAAGYYGHTKGLHTISISVANFRGRIIIQGSQQIDPTEDDWFVVNLPEEYTTPYIQYPRAAYIQRNPNLRSGETSTIGFNFWVNCLWLRVVVSRDYLLPAVVPPYGSSMSDAISWLGRVDNILVNY